MNSPSLLEYDIDAPAEADAMDTSRCLRLDQDLTIDHAAQMLPWLEQAMLGGGELVLDVSAVRDIDCSGIQLLLAMRNVARVHGTRLSVTGLETAMRDQVARLGLQRRLAEEP